MNMEDKLVKIIRYEVYPVGIEIDLTNPPLSISRRSLAGQVPNIVCSTGRSKWNSYKMIYKCNGRFLLNSVL